MTLFAKVRKLTGVTAVLEDEFEDEVAGPPARAEILPDSSGYFLLRYTADDKFEGESWHEDLEGAKQQALAELSILSEDWSKER